MGKMVEQFRGVVMGGGFTENDVSAFLAEEQEG